MDALGGGPGVPQRAVRGARGADDDANRRKLLADLAGSETRTARFRTVLAYVDADGLRTYDGVCEGLIATEEAGTAGFGYDSVFRPAPGDGPDVRRDDGGGEETGSATAAAPSTPSSLG